MQARALEAVDSPSAATSGTAVGARIGRLAVPTRDATQALGPGLLPLLDSVRRRAGAQILVVDDAARAVDAATWERATQAAASVGVELQRMGAAHKRSFAELLAQRAGVDPALVRFALLDDLAPGAAFGAARNVILLASAGEPVLSLDDDVGGWLARAPERQPGIALCDDDPTEFRFHAGLGDAIGSVRPTQRSLLRVHESVLGRSAAELVANGAPAPPMGADVAAREAEGGDLVIASANGIVGDVATPNPLHYLNQTGAARERLVGDAAEFAAAWSSRQGIRAARRLTLGDGLVWSTGAAAYDARQRLPPFFPVMRGEGLVWGATVRTCRSGLLAHLPWVVPHLPLSLRSATQDAPSVGFTTARLLYQLVSERAEACLACAPGVRLAVLGQHLASMAKLPRNEFAAQIAERRVAQDMAVEMSLESLLVRYDAEPAHWAAAVNGYLDGLRAAQIAPGYDVPTDLVERFGAERGAVVCQELVARYAQLLLEWPAIWDAALEQRRSGTLPLA